MRSRSRFTELALLLAAVAVLSLACAGPHPAGLPPESGVLLSALKERQAALGSFILEGRCKVSSSRGSLRGDVSVVAARPDSLRLEAHGPFGQPALFVVIRGDQVQAINFFERRYLSGQITSPRIASLLPLNLPAGELISLLSAAPLPDGISGCRGAPLDEASDLQREAKERGGALLVIEGAQPERLLFGDGPELVAASVGRPDAQIVAIYSDWRGVGDIRFPFKLEFSVPSTKRGLSLDLSEAKLNVPVSAATFTLEPPAGFKVVEVP